MENGGETEGVLTRSTRGHCHSGVMPESPPKEILYLGEVGSCVTLSFVDTGDVTLPPIELLKY